jgi:transcriptional regulator with XRE-family HTH domain
MTDTITLGSYLRLERESRGLSLKDISDSTKVSIGLLEGLEADDISKWPGGIFRRAFVRSYAQCVGLDADDVYKRFEQQFQPAEPEPAVPVNGSSVAVPAPTPSPSAAERTATSPIPRRSRLVGTAADLTVACVLAFGSAAAGSRLLWPVLMIAAYYAFGVLTTGTSPMVALLREPDPSPAAPDGIGVAEAAARAASGQRPEPRRAFDPAVRIN